MAPSDPFPELEPLLAMLDLLPLEGACELERALFLRRNPEPTARDRRLAELGPLHALLQGAPVDPWTGESMLERQTYDRLRPKGAPSGRALGERYRSWPKARRAALGMTADGRRIGPGQPWVTYSGGVRPYSREECLLAYRACALSLGRRPSSQRYIDWVASQKRLERATGAEQARVPLYRVIRRFFGSWAAFAAATRLSEAELDVAWAHRLNVPVPVTTAGAQPTERARALSAEALTALELTKVERKALRDGRLLKLRLSRAAQLANELSGSLAWLSGHTLELGAPTMRDVVFDAAAYKRLRGEQAVPEALVLGCTGWSLGALRRVVRGAEEPTLGAVATIASLLGVEVGELCAVLVS